MNKLTEAAIKQHNLIEKGETVVCGLSGGADSVAMVLVMCELSHIMGFKVCAAHLNHLIRGEEADQDEHFVRELCRERDIPLYVRQISAVEYAAERGLGLEEGARQLRYCFFDEAAAFFGANKIATAHNADDNLETVIFNLQRGSGIAGLCGIPIKRGNIIRPIIFCDRKNILRYLSEKQQNYRTDSTNSCTDYARNRIRLNIIPEIKKINPTASAVVARNSEMLRNDCDYFEQEVGRIVAENCKIDANSVQISADFLNKLHVALSTRVVRAMIGRLAGMKDYTNRHISAVIALAESTSGSGEISLPSEMYAIKRGGILEIRRGYPEPAIKIAERSLIIGGKTLLPEIGMVVECDKLKINCKFKQTTDTFCINCDKIAGDAVVRSANSGDKITLAKRNVTKTMKKLMTEMKIPAYLRGQIPVIADKNGIIAVFGAGCDKGRLPDENTENCLYIKIRSVKHDD